MALTLDGLEHLGERLTPVDGRVGCPHEDVAELIPDRLPFWVVARQVEFGEHAFEPVDQFGMALKPRISATLGRVDKSVDAGIVN